jgi:hypothetical protein
MSTSYLKKEAVSAPKPWLPFARLEYVRTQKTTVEIFTAAKTSMGQHVKIRKETVTAYLSREYSGMWKVSSLETT